jgi:orotidine-5'-phosphate decarboxylase
MDTAVKLAMLAQESGLRGVVASPHDIESIRRACGDDLIIVAPGIRVNGATDDQRRTATPAAAIAAGANYIVVGRPITAAADPRSAAQAIVDSLR